MIWPIWYGLYGLTYMIEAVGPRTYMILNKEDSSAVDNPMVYLDQVNSSFDNHQYLSKQNYSIHFIQFTFTFW